MKQTAVEWLIEQLNKKGFAPVVTDEEIEQAKAMEKGQHKQTWLAQFDNAAEMTYKKDFEQYYNETFNNYGKPKRSISFNRR
jgi:hypothetical protein